MPQKAMVFIDGSWFYHSRQILFDLKDETGFEIDYKRLPLLVGQWVGDALDADVDVVRACYFGTLPLNKPGYNPAKQRVFYLFLQQDCGYEVEVLEMDHRLEHGISDGRRVGVALAASMMHFASMPGAFDTAILMGGSSDYRPLLRRVRDRGKRTLLVAMNNAENRQATSPVLLVDHALFDAPPVFLDEHIDEIRLVRKELPRACKACGQTEVTTWAGVEFYCSKCRSDHHRRVRTCDTCGREEETTWDKDYFYCSQCRKEFRRNGGARAEETSFTI